MITSTCSVPPLSSRAASVVEWASRLQPGPRGLRASGYRTSPRERIIDIASTQFPDGGCYHQYQPLTKRGNNDIGGGFNDDPMWLIFGTVAYIKESGDFSILMSPSPSTTKKVWKCSVRAPALPPSTTSSRTRPPTCCSLIGRADWNDCSNRTASPDPNDPSQTTENQTEGSQGESLMIAGLFVVCGRDYGARAAAWVKTTKQTERKPYIDNMVEAVKNTADGDWFACAPTITSGHKVGSKENEEGQIFIESQGWCTMAGIGLEEGMVEKALDSSERLTANTVLYSTIHPFTRYVVEYGEISTYPAGYKENAGIFCHNNPWVIIGETVLGRGDRSWEYFRNIPVVHRRAQCPA